MKKTVCMLLTAAMAIGSMGGAAMAEETVAYEVATVRWSDWGEDYHTGFRMKLLQRQE